MFEIGSLVVYGSGGVYRIDDIRNEDFSGSTRKYYVMSGIDSASTTVFVPIDSELLTARMKPLATKEEIDGLIADMPIEALDWPTDTKARNEKFRNIIENGDRAELLRLMRTVYLKKQELTAAGRRLYATDENNFKRAEKMILDEFSAVLGVDGDEVIKMIADRVETA